MDIPELLASIVGSTFRHLLTGVGVYLVNAGWISADDWTKLLAGIILMVSGLLWSWYLKWKASQNPAPVI
jgi:membrane protein DedA with SNARE-associated domain